MPKWRCSGNRRGFLKLAGLYAGAAALGVPMQAKAVSAADRTKTFDRWDTNKDGVLTLDEYKAGLKGQDNLETRFKNFDNNSDGKLTREEFVTPSGK